MCVLVHITHWKYTALSWLVASDLIAESVMLVLVFSLLDGMVCCNYVFKFLKNTKTGPARGTTAFYGECQHFSVSCNILITLLMEPNAWITTLKSSLLHLNYFLQRITYIFIIILVFLCREFYILSGKLYLHKSQCQLAASIQHSYSWVHVPVTPLSGCTKVAHKDECAASIC